MLLRRRAPVVLENFQVEQKLDEPSHQPADDEPRGENAQIERSSIARNVTTMLSSQVVTWSLSLVLAIVQPRFLGPALEGRMRLAFSLWTIASVVIALGTSTYLQLETARRGSEALKLMGPILALRMIVFTATLAIFGAGVVVAGADLQFVAILGLFAVNILLSTWTDVYGSVFVGLERMSAPAVVSVITRFVGTIAAVIVLFAGGRVISVLIVAIASNVIGLTLIVRALRKIVRVRLELGRALWKTIWSGSFAFMMTAAILTLYQQVDTVIIALFVDERALGWYGAADTLFGTLLFLPTIVCASIFPTLGRLYEADPAAFVALVRRTFATIMLVAVPIGLGTVVVAETAAPILYGEKYRETGQVLTVLGVVLIVTTVTILVSTVAMATGRQRFWNVVMFVAVLMTIPLDVVFVPWADRRYENGAIGGALAYVVTEAMMFFIGIWRIAPYLVERSTIWRSSRVLLAGGIMLAATWPTRGMFLGLTVALGALVYVVAIVVLRVLTHEERALARKAMARVGLPIS